MKYRMGGNMLIAALVVSFVVAQWLVRLALTGVFRMMPASRLGGVPARPVQSRAAEVVSRRAA